MFHWDTDGTQMITAIRKAAGNPNLNVTKTPWALMRLLSPFVPLFREVCEMRYLWQMPVHMNNAKLRGVLGEEPHNRAGCRRACDLEWIGMSAGRADENCRDVVIGLTTGFA